MPEMLFSELFCGFLSTNIRLFSVHEWNGINSVEWDILNSIGHSFDLLAIGRRTFQFSPSFRNKRWHFQWCKKETTEKNCEWPKTRKSNEVVLRSFINENRRTAKNCLFSFFSFLFFAFCAKSHFFPSLFSFRLRKNSKCHCIGLLSYCIQSWKCNL